MLILTKPATLSCVIHASDSCPILSPISISKMSLIAAIAAALHICSADSGEYGDSLLNLAAIHPTEAE